MYNGDIEKHILVQQNVNRYTVHTVNFLTFFLIWNLTCTLLICKVYIPYIVFKFGIETALVNLLS